MVNKRRQNRPNSPHRINVLAASDDHLLGRLVNITTGGLMFLTTEAFQQGDAIDVRLPLPTMRHDRNSIDVTGRVVWRGTDSNPRYTRVGLEFENLGAEEGYIIETILQRLHLVG